MRRVGLVSFRSQIQMDSRSLRMALLLSVLVHLIILSVRFVAPMTGQGRIQSDGLEVVLVNTRSAWVPKDVDVLAQQNVAGGGSHPDNVHAKTFLPPQSAAADEVSLQQERARNRPSQIEQRWLAVVPRLGDLFSSKPSPRVPDTPSEQGVGDRHLDLSTLDIRGQISELLEAQNKGNRRLSLGITAREVEHAHYTNQIATRIEQLGRLNFPDAARGKPFSVMVSMSIRGNGSLEKVEILRTSGSQALDREAGQLISRAFPFEAFPPSIRRQYDALDMVRTIYFIPTGSTLVKDDL